MQDRIRRIAKLYDLSDAKAKDKITKIDKQRASYYNYYTSKRWGEVDSYDLCLNSSVFGIDGTVDMIKQAIEVKEAGIRKIFQHLIKTEHRRNDPPLKNKRRVIL